MITYQLRAKLFEADAALHIWFCRVLWRCDHDESKWAESQMGLGECAQNGLGMGPHDHGAWAQRGPDESTRIGTNGPKAQSMELKMNDPIYNIFLIHA